MHHQILSTLHAHVDGVEQTVRLQGLRPVRNVVLMTELVSDVLKALLQIFHLKREEGAPAGLGGVVFNTTPPRPAGAPSSRLRWKIWSRALRTSLTSSVISTTFRTGRSP